MEIKPNVDIDVDPLELNRGQEEVYVVDPDHVVVTPNVHEGLHEFLIDIRIHMPHVSVHFVNFILVDTLEIVEKWAHTLFIVDQELGDLLLLEKDGYAILSG